MAARIRTHDWGGTPLGPVDSWPQSLKTSVDTILGLPTPAVVWWGPQHVQIYNDAFIPIARERHPQLLGQPAAIGWADVFEVVQGLLSTVLDGKAVQLRDYAAVLDGPTGPEERVFNANWSPLRDEAGTVAGALQTLTEVTETHRAQAALQASEARLAAAFEGVPAGVAVLDLTGQIVLANSEYRRFLPTGVIPSHDLDRGWRWRAWDEKGRPLEPHDFPGARAMRGERVVPGQEMLFTSDDGREIWTRVATVPIRSTEGEVVGQSSVISDIDALKRSTDALRQSEERQAFLLKVSDALRPLNDPVAIQDVAARFVGEHLKVSRAVYAEFTTADGQEIVVIEREHRAAGATSFVGRHPADQFGPDVHDLRAGRTIAVDDTEAEHSREDLKEVWRTLGVRSRLGIPLVKQGRLVVGFGVHSADPRAWKEADIALVAEVAERTWAAVERARAEGRLHESEERFQQFARASASGLWIRNASTLAMEFVSPAIGTIYGVEPHVLLGNVERWAAMIVPDDRDLALGHLEGARMGTVTMHEFRIQRPSDGAFRWIRNTDFPLRDNGHIPRIGGIAEDVTDSKLATEHSAVLLAELQHRVRNIMALLRSITDRTGERAESVADYRGLMMGRLLAFARVQALLTRTANVSVGIASIVHDEVSAQAQHEGQYVFDGPDVVLSPKAAEVLTLAIHELATNAVKYGALSVPDGKVAVRWSTWEKRSGPWLSFDWIEEGAPARLEPEPGTPRRRGFGSELIEGRIPYELRGRGKVRIGPGGARCHLEFPLQGGASILETGAPQRAAVFGGAIDMTGEPDLIGRRVLVVEDDYYLATDAARALLEAGAEVMGPCATEEDARAELEDQRPDAVVVDINLGLGPSFKLAEALKDRGIPFVFTTGYDAEVIPAEFDGVERLQKPLQLRQIVGAVAKLTTAA